jgi:hypothetical protein
MQVRAVVATKGRKAGGLPGRRLGDVSPSLADGRVFVITLRGLARATIHSVDTPPGRGYPTAMLTRRLDVQPRRGRDGVKGCHVCRPSQPFPHPELLALDTRSDVRGLRAVLGTACKRLYMLLFYW